MALIKSISGIRGTIGGKAGEGLSPLDTVKFASAFAYWIKRKKDSAHGLSIKKGPKKNNALKGRAEEESSYDKTKIVIGRDARISGEMVKNLVVGNIYNQYA